MEANFSYRISCSKRFTNFEFNCSNLKLLWNTCKSDLFEEKVIGINLKDCVIIVCQSDSDWKDYLLLHHFDESIPLDDF